MTLASSPASNVASSLILSRQPIFNARYAPLGHQILLKDRETGTRQPVENFFHALQESGIDDALGRGLTFLRCKADENIPAFDELLDPKRIVIELDAPDDVETRLAFNNRVDALLARGMQISVGEYALHSDFRTLLSKVQFLKVDTRKVPTPLLKVLPQKLYPLQSLKLIASHLTSSDLHKEMVTARYHCFQGGLKCAGLIGKKTIDASRKNILILMKMAQEEVNFSEIETVLKGDPGLTFSVLRHVNSPAFAQRMPTTSLTRATQLLGHKKLYRWLSIRLMATSNHPAEKLLLCAALTRGRLMELLAPVCTPKLSADDAFVVGVFSLLDKLLGVTIEEALAEVPLPDQVMSAFDYMGPLGSLLYSVKACELPDREEERMVQEDELGIEGQIMQTHLQAAQWAEAIMQE